MVRFLARAACLIRESGGLPWWDAIVPAESQLIFLLSPRSATNFLKVHSAAGERQIFPQHTNSTCISIKDVPTIESFDKE